MAEEEKNEEQGEGQGKSKKGLIIAIVAVVLAIGASVGVTVFLLGGDDTASDEEISEPVEEVKDPLVYFDFKPPILTTFNIGGRPRYMQIHLSVASRNAEAISAAEHHLPLLRSRLNSMFSTQKFDEIQTDEGKKALREATLILVNEVLVAEGESEIEQVYFSNFVLQ